MMGLVHERGYEGAGVGVGRIRRNVSSANAELKQFLHTAAPTVMWFNLKSRSKEDNSF